MRNGPVLLWALVRIPATHCYIPSAPTLNAPLGGAREMLLLAEVPAAEEEESGHGAGKV